MKAQIKSDTVLASFIVAVFASFLLALAFLLIRVIAAATPKANFIVDYFLNIYILFLFGGFVFYKGSHVAAWLVYRHDVAWGYKVELHQVLPIFFISFAMAVCVYFAIQYFIVAQVPLLAYLERAARLGG